MRKTRRADTDRIKIGYRRGEYKPGIDERNKSGIDVEIK